MTIFLIGYMACGKTTFGRALARRSGMDFIDLDFYIEQRFRKSITQIFSEKGEEEFRRIESAMLREVGEFENVIISCGGGTPCFHDNIGYMLGRGDVVWLQASVERIVERLIINSSRRPLMKGKSPDELREAVEAGLAAREQYYSRAGIHFPSDQLEDRRQIDRTVDTFLAAHPYT